MPRPQVLVDIETLQNSLSRIEKYNIPTIVRTQLLSISTVNGNPVPVTRWEEDTDFLSTAGDTYVRGEYHIVASSASDTIPLINDGDNSTGWSESDVTSSWIKYVLPESLRVSKFSISYSSSDPLNASTYTIQGSNDGSTWIDLATGGETGGAETEITITTPGYYTQYRFVTSTSVDAVGYVRKFAITQYSVHNYENRLTLPNLVVENLVDGDRLLIETPNTLNSVAVIENYLNELQIYTILQPNKKYELNYRTESGSGIFTTREVI